MALAEPGWQQLKPISKSLCPKLFYNFIFNNFDFELLFTDLIGLWSCKRSEAQIINEAKRLKSSIDPSESKGQLEVLLNKLQQSLCQGETVIKRHGTHDSVIIQTELSLPKPLKPLLWMFHLEPLGAGGMAEQILRPCLHEASESQRKIASLHEVITTKDNVIEKLLDRINSSSTDLSVIFPGITGLRSKKGQVTSKDALKHVPGLGRFNAAAWSKQFESDDQYAKFTTSGLSMLVAGCEACPEHIIREHEDWLQKMPIITDTELDDWTNENVSPSKLRATMLKGSDVKATNTESKDGNSTLPIKSASTSHKKDASEDVTLAEDDFETQRISHKVKRKRPGNNESSGSEEEQPGRKRSRLGGLKNQQSSSRMAGPKSSIEAKTARKDLSNRSNSDAEDSSTASESPAKSYGHSQNSHLDVSGRGRKTSSPNHDIAPTTTSSPLHRQSSSLTSTPRKLGRLKNSSSPGGPSTSEPPLSTPRRRLGRLGSKEPGQSQQEDRSVSGTPSRTLGRIGGKSRGSQRLDPVAESSDDSENEARVTASSRIRSRIGKRKDKESGSTASETEEANTGRVGGYNQDVKQGSHSPPTQVQVAGEESAKEETAAEKAQRRREELKRKIGPAMAVRRKRKF